ncbi:Gfo/Idh/MocA family oxidoreductase [uncultured Rikenella sp.]|uniref:Gfo/Idh/MocA family oxidoreductase n=1 Tax=uncultured Rikenella sp. TaxID=368003 RepID=UPI00272DB02C|nr:Gfo/Idh/MocA family oxidoreductase [uncultured Rikenella sp.]
MNILIIGAGRMGIRHLQGALQSKHCRQVTILDINPDALAEARTASQDDPRLSTKLVTEFQAEPMDVCIIASTAKNRRPLIDLAAACGCKWLMIEKPLGQSLNEVKELITYTDSLPLTTVVNLNMRLYKPVRALKADLCTVPQMQGEKTITINTGTLGIGCNGIHYLDKVFFFLDADRAEIVAAEIDERIIPSGRGSDFGDFGGWAVIKFYQKENYVGKLMISMAADSPVFGSWEIVAPFARIVIDEIAATRRTILRKIDSTMPIYRYAADFEEQPIQKYEAPFLGDLTTQWLDGLSNGVNLLPELAESFKAHQLMFEWLSYSKTYKEIFPIT